MNEKSLKNFKMYYCKSKNGSDHIGTFSDINGYKNLIKYIEEYILLIKEDQQLNIQ